jgi:hypothetical protein
LGSLVEARDLARKALELSPMSKIAKKILKDAEETERGEGGSPV